MYKQLEPKTDFRIGEIVDINWNKKDYEGKSVRRGVMDKLIERCMGLPVSNLSNYVINMRYLLDTKEREELKIIKDFVKGKRHALPRISDEKRDWIRSISEAITNFKEGVIVGMEVVPHHISEICPCHISYITDRPTQLIRFKVMVVGVINKDTDKEREVVFKVNLLTNDIKKL